MCPNIDLLFSYSVDKKIEVNILNFYFFLQILCNKHDNGGKIPIRQGEVVYAKHKNTRYYHANVLSVSDKICFLVVFKDESFSNDLPPEDVVVSLLLKKTFTRTINYVGLITNTFYIPLFRIINLEGYLRLVLK